MKHRTILIGLFVVLSAALLVTGCSGEKITISPDLEALSLVEVWEMTAQTMDVQDGSAEMESLLLHADDKGNIDSLSFVFHGNDSKGRPKAYFVSRYSNGEIDCHYHRSNLVTATRHPVEVFTEIDALGLASLERGEDGLSIQIDFTSGDVGYSHDYTDIYHLEGGELKQLEKIVFHSQTPWCTIDVFKLSPPDTVISENGEITAKCTTVAGPVSPEDRTSQIWFLTDDIYKAAVVEYLHGD